jgi:hypothetical protein
MMVKITLVFGIIGAIFLTSLYAIAQTESGNQKLGAPGAARESDKNIGPGPSDSTSGSDNKPTNRRSAPSKGKKQSSGGSHKSQSPAQSGGRTSEAPGG